MPLRSVISCDTTHKNDFRHPYILMTHLPEKRVCEVWKGPGEPPTKDLDLDHEDCLKADGTEPYIGKTYEVLEDGIGHEGQVLHRTQMSATFSSSYDHSRAQSAIWWSRYESNGEASASLAMGQYEVLRLVVDCLPFPVGEKETSTMTPPDFDRQNIFVDNDGNATGFIDWDATCAVSRFQGFDAIPFWLGDDFSYDLASVLSLLLHIF
ncbi:hypothetical protein HDK90DRAFT_536197 [Phyllosticta capitalensis]|uniref:Aminoglycoside phosphotransferase domain-containing protein n=1 Tax=Phyllosticta capitalensis TaxID=121624 RepID=A0ABR1YHD1_9PEZI